MAPRVDFGLRSLSLEPGVYVFGATDSDPTVEESRIVVGGYEITVPDAPDNSFVYAHVESVSRRKFGPNTARATMVDIPSATTAARGTRTGLRYKTQAGRWFPANRGPVEHDLLQQLVIEARATRSTDVFVPGYDPRAAVAAGIDLALDAPRGSTIGIYSPGTQTHWGTIRDLRSEYGRYGLSPKMGVLENAVPLDEVIPCVSASKRPSEESHPESRLVVSRDADELLDGPQLDYLVVNHLARTKLDDRQALETITSRWSDTAIFTLWSTFTKRESDGVPNYSPPLDTDSNLATPNVAQMPSDIDPHETGVDRLSPDLSVDAESLPAPPTTTDFSRLCSDNSVTLERLPAQSLTGLLEDVFSEWQNLSDAGAEQSSSLLFNALMFFHRLPLPREHFDEIILQRRYDGEIFLPKTGEEYLDELESHTPRGEYSLLHAQKTLEGVHRELQTDNPMFEQLLEYAIQARNEDHRIAIFVHSKTVGELLETALCRELSVETLHPHVDVVNLHSGRDIARVDTVVVCGPQRPEYTSFYIHPRAEDTIVLTYTDWGERMIERHVKKYARALESLLSRDVDVSFLHSTDGAKSEVAEPDVEDDENRSTTESERTERSETVPDDLSDQDIGRLQIIAQLQPTKNDELVDRWGYDTGSELYQYLSSSLDAYYTRNEDYRIVLTAEGRAVLDAVNQTF